MHETDLHFFFFIQNFDKNIFCQELLCELVVKVSTILHFCYVSACQIYSKYLHFDKTHLLLFKHN